ncbi:MAG: GuaB3 family IMP dehydrogenase-related protein [Elusimicrobiota bacterium]
MPFFIGKDKEARRAYGFDEVAIAPGEVTVNPEDVDLSIDIGPVHLKIPFLASAMDAVVDVEFAAVLSKAGGLAVLNLDGVQTRYDDPIAALERIVNAKDGEATRIVQEVYSKPVREELIAKRIKELKKAGAIAAVSTVPQNAARYAPIVEKAGAEMFIIQATVVTARHISKSSAPLDLKALGKTLKIPFIVGNCVTYKSALELMETGAAGILVGVGPGSACTSREVLGIGVPQVTAIADTVRARDDYFRKSSRHVAIIADGGMVKSGDVCKAIACGADAVMMGGVFARALEAPGGGYHWGMAMPSRYLPRGTRVRVGQTAPLRQILFGPSMDEDGRQNLTGALATCMGYVGATTVREFQMAEVIIAPEIKHEGKVLQRSQRNQHEAQPVATELGFSKHKARG